jgi:hypothetical protein
MVKSHGLMNDVKNELSIKKNETFVLKLPIVYIEHVGVV